MFLNYSTKIVSKRVITVTVEFYVDTDGTKIYFLIENNKNGKKVRWMENVIKPPMVHFC